MGKQAAEQAGVLVINDSPVARAVIIAVVQAAPDFRLVGQAASGLAGVEQAARLRPDLVLLDMHMPDINGVEVTRRVLALRPTRILICTATIRRNTGYLFDALKAGALDYCRTPSIDARPGERVGREALLAAGGGLLGKMQTVLGLPLRCRRCRRARAPASSAPQRRRRRHRAARRGRRASSASAAPPAGRARSRRCSRRCRGGSRRRCW
jgi:chemotaxis response regulator CheB